MANKKITELQLVSAITDDLNFPVDDTLQTYRATVGQVKSYLAPIYLRPSIEKMLSGTGTLYKHLTFICGTASATVGATYTNNSNTYTVVDTITSKNSIVLSGPAAPTASGTLTKASGTGDATITFSSVREPIYMRVRAVGGGGGGDAGGTASSGVGNGGNTTFASTVVVANGGAAGARGGNGGGGGTASLGTGAIGIALQGGSGTGGGLEQSAGALNHIPGGGGAASPFGGAGGGAGFSANAIAAITNTGSGGGGGQGNGNVSGNVSGGAGGGAGGYADAMIYDIASTWSWAWVVGAAGAKGTSSANGTDGSAGGSGMLEATFHFQ